MSNANEKSMQDQSFPSKDADKSAHLHIDNIDEILKITDSFEMDNVIAKNSSTIGRVFDQFLNKLYSKADVSKEQIDHLIYCLKFVDTLNLFMPHFPLSKLSEYMNKIFNQMLISSNTADIKDLVIKQIKYTEMTVITLKKKEFKNLFFGDGKGLAAEIEFNLEQVNKNGKFDQKLFKQLQNLFYVVQGRIEESKRSDLQQRMNEMKTTSIKYKKQKVYLNYDDYNDYSDYKNYSNVSGNLHDYNENFYDNEDYSYSNYNSYNQERYGYRRHSYRNNGNYHHKHFENEEREVEYAVELELKEKEVNEDKQGYAKEKEEVHLPSIDDKANMSTPMNENKREENSGNIDVRNDIEIIKTVAPSKYEYSSNSHYNRNSNYNQQPNQSSHQGNKNDQTPVKKKIILKKNQKQRGQTLVEVPISSNSEENKPTKVQKVIAVEVKYGETALKTEDTKSKEAVLPSNQSSVNTANETEIIISQDSSQKQQQPHSNQKYNQYGYKQNQYGKNQNYYYNYNSNYHNNSYNNPNHYHHNNYYSNSQSQNDQPGFKSINNQNDAFSSYNNAYYKKNPQNKKYYQAKAPLDFVELDNKSDKKEQNAQSSPEVKREELDDLSKLKNDKDAVKMDLEKMFEKEKQKGKEDKETPEVSQRDVIDLKEAINEENISSEPIQEPMLSEEIDDEEENEEIDKEESSDSIGDEELEREYNKFICENLGQIPKSNDDNYYIDQEDDSNKNNKIVFEDEGEKDEEIPKESKEQDQQTSLVNPSLLIPSIEPHEIASVSQVLPPIEPSSLIAERTGLLSDVSTLPREKEEALIQPQEEVKAEKEQNQKEKDESALPETTEQLKSNKYTDSIKTIDPKVLKTIKSKLSEDFQKNQQHQSQQQMPAYVNFQASFPNGNSQMFHPGLLSIMAYYQAQLPNAKLSLQSYIFNHYTQFLYQGRDSNLHKEYLLLKAQEIENSYAIWQNISNFENKIIIPIYQRINFNVNKKRKVYYITFMKYKKLIQHILAKDKVLEKVKPYGSYMNNFLIDSGDIDICIVPKCNILEFASYLDKIKEHIVVKSIGEHKLSHHTGRYLLLKVLDIQTKFIVDITVHTMLPILNTNLVRLYSLYDQRFHILGLYIKHWAKINKIHGAADNFLSSYALLLMLIHFLQKVVEPRVLPNLQKIEQKEIPYHYYVNGETITTNIYYEEDLNKIKTYMKKVNNGLENKETATNLLVKFFEYYSYYFEPEQRIAIHKEGSELVKKTSETIAFSIEDPFDVQHDPGKSMNVNSIQCNKFITSMKKEVNFILNGEYVKRIDKICSNSNAGKN